MSSVLEKGSATTTADDTLKAKSREAGVISGGHLVARALKNEGVDTIFTLCGGHIIDIYDGCVDEGIRIIDVRDERAAVFDAFYTGKTEQAGKVKGTGIGLSVVTEFVQAHGGTIELVDGVHPGAHFRIRLPARPATRRSEAEADAAA